MCLLLQKYQTQRLLWKVRNPCLLKMPEVRVRRDGAVLWLLRAATAWLRHGIGVGVSGGNCRGSCGSPFCHRPLVAVQVGDLRPAESKAAKNMVVTELLAHRVGINGRTVPNLDGQHEAK